MERFTIAVKRLAPHEPRILANAVEDHNRVVHRIADQSQKRRDHRQRNLKVQERKKPSVIRTS